MSKVLISFPFRFLWNKGKISQIARRINRLKLRIDKEAIWFFIWQKYNTHCDRTGVIDSWHLSCLINIHNQPKARINWYIYGKIQYGSVMYYFITSIQSQQITRFMGPTWAPLGPRLATWTLLSGMIIHCNIYYLLIYSVMSVFSTSAITVL